MDTTQWPQDTVLKPMEEIVTNNNTIKGAVGANLERKGGGAIRPPHKKEIEGVNCPRCNSTNTKFCYYNNYSLTQPRYFCKTCKRYWTAGGTLRNIPVGGGSRKNKRSSISTSSSSKKINLDLVNPKINYNLEGHVEGQDLNLGFSKTAQDFKAISELIQVPNFDTKKESFSSAMELLNGISPRGFNSFFPMPIGSDPVYNNGFSLMSDFKPSALSFSLDGLVGNGGGGVYGSLQDVQETTSGMLLFPFEDLKQVSGTTTSATTTNDHNNIEQQQNRDQNGDSNGFWNGVLGGGSW